MQSGNFTDVFVEKRKLGSNQGAGSGIKLRQLGPSEAAADFSFWFEARSLQFEVLWTRFIKLTSVPARLQVTYLSMVAFWLAKFSDSDPEHVHALTWNIAPSRVIVLT